MARLLTDHEDFDGLTRTEKTLASARYHDPAHYRRELRDIWYRHWIYLCRADGLDRPLAFRTFTVGSQRILLLRDDKGALRAFHNTCRHRGSILCREAEGRFKSKAIVCPYHQWTYRPDGRLLQTSSLAEAPDLDKTALGLYDIALTEWRGSVFVSLAETPPPFSLSTKERAGSFENWPLEDLVVGHSWRKTMACNWKVFWENFNECLHCPNVHPELTDLVPIYGRRISRSRDDPDWALKAGSADPRDKGGLKAGAETWSLDGQAHGATFPNLSPAEREAGQSFFVNLPSTYMAAHLDYVRVIRLLPLGPEETELQAEWLFPAETLQDPAFDLGNVVDFAKTVLSQDAEISELNQQGLHCLRHEHGVLMPEEHHLHRFHQWVEESLRDD